jgi:peptidylprolyl isomerase
MINKFEAIGIFGSIGVMVIVLLLVRANEAKAPVTTSGLDTGSTVTVATSSSDQAGKDALYSALTMALSQSGDVQKLVIDDVTTGTGTVAQAGDTVTVNYIGTLKDGTEFDNSYKRGQPFSFTLGANQVIKGWDQGVAGMKVGGKRILVIPADLAYGNRAVGPIPANSTLVFAVQLLDVKAGGKGGK